MYPYLTPDRGSIRAGPLTHSRCVPNWPFSRFHPTPLAQACNCRLYPFTFHRSCTSYIMVPPGASTAEAVSAAQKPMSSPMQVAAVDARPGQPPEAPAPDTAGTNSAVKIPINLSDAAVDLAGQPDPAEVQERFSKLRDAFTPSKEFTRYLDNLSLQLHCPPPLLTPLPYPPHQNPPSSYQLVAYSAHGPVRRTRPSPPPHHDSMPTSTSLRYRLMGKAMVDPRFHYVPPSRPISRVHSAAAMRSTPEPAHRNGSTRATGAVELAPSAGASRMQVMQKMCAVCRRLHDVLRTATKARYCVQCEKLRWQLRAFGGKVHHLRAAYERVNDPDDVPAILQAAKTFAKAEEEPGAAAAPAPQARSVSAAASDSRPASAAPSSVGVATDGDTDMDTGEQRGGASAEAADGPFPSADAATRNGDAGGSADDETEATVPQVEEDLDELAALLAGNPSSSAAVRHRFCHCLLWLAVHASEACVGGSSQRGGGKLLGAGGGATAACHGCIPRL